MFHLRKRVETSSARWARRGVALGASLAATALVCLATAGTAGATAVPPANVTYPAASANNIIVGSGSAATYAMMESLGQLFNQVPGCDITSTSITGGPTKHLQQLNYACEYTKTTGKVLEQVTGNSYLDNPINDVSVEEPPIGSSNGIAALEIGRNQTGTTIGNYFGNPNDCTRPKTTGGPVTKYNCSSKQDVSAINFARASRTLSTKKDVKGLNFVAYAQDGIAPFYFSEFDGATTPAAKAAADITGTNLFRIWNGTVFDWGQLGAATSYPIFVFSAQEGSGTQATFKTYLEAQKAASIHPKFDPSTESNHVNCKDPVMAGTTVTQTTGTTPGTFTVKTGTKIVPRTIVHTDGTYSTCKGPEDIFENEDASILRDATAKTESARAKAWSAEQLTTSVSPVEGGIFYYAYGTYTKQCAGVSDVYTYLDGSKTTVSSYKAGTHCGSVPLPTGDKVTLSQVNGFTANAKTIVTHTWPITRYLNNVYSNGHNPDLPPATAATLNFVSEIGFLCKTQTVTGKAGKKPKNTYTAPKATTTKDITDPTTGLWYHDEVFDAITQNGFIPLDVVPSNKFGTITDGTPALEDVHAAQTAYALLSKTAAGTKTYLMTGANKSITSSADPTGYCLVHSTTTGGSTVT